MSKRRALRQRVRALLRNAGFDVVRFDPAAHPLARRARLLREARVDVVIDVGANAGQYGAELRGLGYEGDIVSFEPLADACADLERRAASDPRWRVVQGAWSEIDGTTTLHVAGNSFSSSLLPMLDRHVESAPQSGFIRDELVPTVAARRTLLEHASGRRCLLKLDVQGYEGRLLQAVADALDAVTGVQLEMSLVPLYDGETLMPGLIAQLAQHGFVLMGVEPGYTDSRTGQLLQLDGIFFRPDLA